MRDPREGLAPDGTITTGASRDRVPASYEPVLADAVAGAPADVSWYLYGSVATGQARPGSSDVDLVAFGLPRDDGAALSRELTSRYAALAREVGIGCWSTDELGGDDAGHGNRVFLRHHCVWLAGTDLAAALPRYPGDASAARGFNGDLPQRLERWSETLDREPQRAGVLGRGVGRKTLFAVAGLVSVHDQTWTTDRAGAAARWGELHPGLAPGLATLLAWGEGTQVATPDELRAGLDGTVRQVTDQFVERIGAWR